MAPWAALVELIAPYYPEGKTGRPPFSLTTMLHTHLQGSSGSYFLLHGQEALGFGDAGYRGIEKRLDARLDITWHVAMRPGKRKKLNKSNEADALLDQAGKLKASVRAKVEHPFRVIKRRFGHLKVRSRGLKRDTAQLFTLFALSNLWMARGKLMGAQAWVRSKAGQRAC